MTPHTADYLCTGAHQLTQETTEDHALNQPTNQLGKVYTNLYHNPEDPKLKTHTERNSGVTIYNPQMDFYSSDDHSSDSEEDSDHLN